MTATTSTGAPQVLTAAGPSLPVPISLDSQRATLPPGIFVQCSRDANLGGIIEVSCDHPDALGNLPVPGTWLQWGQPIGNLAVPVLVAKLDITVTAIRLNLYSYVAGSVTFGVTQNRIPDSAGYYKPVPA